MNKLEHAKDLVKIQLQQNEQADKRVAPLHSASVSIVVAAFALHPISQVQITFFGMLLFLTALVVAFTISVAMPNIGGERSRSMVYFLGIANRTKSKFLEDFDKLNAEDATDDTLEQVWHLARITTRKYTRVKWAVRFAVLDVLCLLALGASTYLKL
jgi:Family of unknown function (DUF5706)